MTLLGVDAAVIRMPDERGIELVARAVQVNDERVDAAARALLSRPQQLPRRELLALLQRSEPLLLDAERAEALGGALALLAPFLRKGSSAALIPIATPAELLATLTIISLASRPAGRGRDRRDRALDRRAGRARDRQRPPLRPAEGLRRHDAALAAAARGARAARARARRRLRVGRAASRSAATSTTTSRSTTAGWPSSSATSPATASTRPPTWRWRSTSSARSPASTSTRAKFLAAANEVVSSEIAPGRFITMVELVIDAAKRRGRVRERRPSAAAARASGRNGRGDPRARARARHRRAAGVRDGHAPFPPGAIVVAYTDGVVEARRGGEQFGLERLDALLAERSGAAAAGRSPQAALAACRDWTEGELTDDFAVVVDQAGGASGMSRSHGSSRGARLRRRHRLARDRDRRLAACWRPYFGSSTIVWANLIGIVLAGLAVGYWLGGRLADRRPEPRLLGLIVLAAAVWVALTPFVARPFLDAAVGNLDDASAGAVIGSFFAVLLLFAPAVVLLGMVSPFAIRLAITDVETAGAVAGRFYALSTFGSLLGTFVPALIAIPLAGTQRTLLATAALLALSASFLLGRKVLVLAAALAALVAVPPGAVKAEAGLLHEEDSLYQFIQVRRARRRPAAAAAERGRRRPLCLARGHRADRRRLGRVPRAAAAPRPTAPEGGDPRQRGRHDRARDGRVLSGCPHRRRRARPGGERRRAASTSGWRTTRT